MPRAPLKQSSSSSKRNPMTLLITKNIQVCFYGTFLLWVAISTSLQSTWQRMNGLSSTDGDLPILPDLNFVQDDGTEFQVLSTDKLMIEDWSQDWDNSPIVIEEYKLLFFTVPKVSCTLWKQLFRRIKGFDDWKSQNGIKYLPHNPRHNGLTYLNQLNTSYATQIFEDKSWTKAIFVRDPKERFLSAFLDKVISNDGVFVRDKCCATEGMRSNCRKDASCQKCVTDALTIPGFLQTIETCHDAHWDPMYDRLEPKYWKYINFVGRMDFLERDGRKLLQQVGAYDAYGSNGWGKYSNSSMFDRMTKSVQSHTTDSNSKVWQFYTPETERLVEEHFENDYRLFQFPRKQLTRDLSHYFVQPIDSVWNHDDWDQSPIVVEKYKLIFFTTPRIGASVWKKAFRRMEGFDNWQATTAALPHDPSQNGLKYLHNYGIEKASEMMTSKEWTKAIFLRNPKDRLMSVYNQYKKEPHQLKQLCCPDDDGCERATQSLPRFLNKMQECQASHWNPQTLRMEEKYWDQINFVGHLENAAYDAKLLLKRIGAWDEIGSSGWGNDAKSQIFAPTGREYDSILSVMSEYTPSVDRLVESYYEMDYRNQKFKFPPVPQVLLYGKKR